MKALRTKKHGPIGFVRRRWYVISAMALVGFATTFAGPATVAWAESPSVTTYDVPSTAYHDALWSNLIRHGFDVPSRIVFPAFKLFSPDGELVKETTDVASGEAFLNSSIPSDNDWSPLQNKPGWSLYADAISKSAAGEVPKSLMTAPDGVWTVLLRSTYVPACRHCAPFEEAVAKLAQQNPEHLRVIVVKTIRN